MTAPCATLSPVHSLEAVAVDPERIGVAGLSLGAITTFALTYNTCCRDERIAEIYDIAAPAKLFVTILGGGHAEPFEDVDDPADAMVQAATTAFWDLYLESPGAAVDDLIAAATVPGLTTVQHDAG